MDFTQQEELADNLRATGDEYFNQGLIKEAMEKYLECKKEIKNEDLCVALRIFITSTLQAQSLSGYLELKMDIWPNEMNEKMMKEYIETFPKDVLVCHAWSFYNKLETLLENTKIMVKEETKKV